MKIVELKRSVTLSDKEYNACEKLAVSENEFTFLLAAGAVKWVDIPFRSLLPAKFQNKSWFELRSFFLEKAGSSRAKDAGSFCDRYGLPVVMLDFLRIPFTPLENNNGTDNKA